MFDELNDFETRVKRCQETVQQLAAARTDTAMRLVELGFPQSVAEDAVQTAYLSATLSVWEKPILNPKAWLRTAAFRVALKVKRDQQRFRLLEDTHQARVVKDSVETEEVVRAVAAALEQLSQDLRETFVRIHVEDQSFEEVGNAMEAHPGTVRRRYQKALLELRDRLRPFGGPEK